MQILSKKEIIHYVNSHNMITPFVDSVIRKPGCLSYGLNDCSYDVRLQEEFSVFTNSHERMIDPKNFDKSCCVNIKQSSFVMPPHSFLLGVTIEKFRIPKDVFVVCLGKSTYARCGIIVNPTCIYPGQEGNIVIELSNTAPAPVKIYAGPSDGICTFVFFKVSDGEGYQGRFQQQEGIRFPSSN